MIFFIPIIFFILLALVGLSAADSIGSAIIKCLPTVMWVCIVIETLVAICFITYIIIYCDKRIIECVVSSISSCITIAFTVICFSWLSSFNGNKMGDTIGLVLFAGPFMLLWLYGVCWLWVVTNMNAMDDENSMYLYLIGEILLASILFAIKLSTL